MTTYVAFDLETTGVNTFRDLPVSYGFVEHVASAGEVLVRREGELVNPGVTIPVGATAVHGINDDMVRDATDLESAVATIVTRLSDVWASDGVLVGMNVSYDLTMTDALCERVYGKGLHEQVGLGPVMDVLILDRHFDKWRKGARKLNDLCRQYGVTIGSAHSAIDDAEASLEVFEAIAAHYPEVAAIGGSEVNATLRAWYQEWLSSFSTYLERKGEPPIESGRYEWPVHTER